MLHCGLKWGRSVLQRSKDPEKLQGCVIRYGQLLDIGRKPTIVTKLLHPQVVLRTVAAARLRVSRGRANPHYGNQNSTTEPDKTASSHSNVPIEINGLRNRTKKKNTDG